MKMQLIMTRTCVGLYTNITLDYWSVPLLRFFISGLPVPEKHMYLAKFTVRKSHPDVPFEEREHVPVPNQLKRYLKTKRVLECELLDSSIFHNIGYNIDISKTTFHNIKDNRNIQIHVPQHQGQHSSEPLRNVTTEIESNA